VDPRAAQISRSTSLPLEVDSLVEVDGLHRRQVEDADRLSDQAPHPRLGSIQPDSQHSDGNELSFAARPSTVGVSIDRGSVDG
jgi:hypothetical protein